MEEEEEDAEAEGGGYHGYQKPQSPPPTMREVSLTPGKATAYQHVPVVHSYIPNTEIFLNSFQFINWIPQNLAELIERIAAITKNRQQSRVQWTDLSTWRTT
ncbi:hypothetical protein ALC53_13411 [Atta colombica]|uniref:Uncharacterized protein n=1 Tax=Atta colombica TaxID=520822 RepID=A0A195AWP0_9HYME|nr:hypothetical protein ALC53_13411 [Atta colombica]